MIESDGTVHTCSDYVGTPIPPLGQFGFNTGDLGTCVGLTRPVAPDPTNFLIGIALYANEDDMQVRGFKNNWSSTTYEMIGTSIIHPF